MDSVQELFMAVQFKLISDQTYLMDLLPALPVLIYFKISCSKV